MVDKEFSPGVLFVALCQFLAVFNGLLILWFMGTSLPEPFASRASPMFVLFGGASLFAGCLDYWSAIRKCTKWLKLKAVAWWLIAIVLFDVWVSDGTVRGRDIALLIISCLGLIPIIWTQALALRLRTR